MLEFQSAYKTYRVARSRPGFAGTIRGLFSPVYGHIKAVQDLSFSIMEGELVGLIGENGAGKSTTVKMATGILRPDKGNVLFNGREVARHRKQCALHYGVTFGQRRSLWWQLPAIEGMEALGRVYRLKSSEIKARIKQLIDLFELHGFADRQVRQLSLGQRIRCEVASCFIHRPKIVFLDEPTIGMDAVAKVKMREYLKVINKEDGVALLLTSHDLFDVERVCERILVLDKGSLILNDSFESMRRMFCSHRVLKLNLGTSFTDGRLDGVEGIELLPVNDRWKLNIRFDPVKKPVIGLMEEVQKRLDVVDFTVEDLPIDEFVAEIYKSRGEEGKE